MTVGVARTTSASMGAMTRRIVLTGAGRGLGRALAERWVAEGDEVWGCTRSGTSTVALAGCVAMDLADEASITTGAAVLAEQLDAVDLLVNCAGVDARAFGSADDNRGPFDLDAATFSAVINVNVTGPMVLTRALLPLLQRGTSATVVNISSQLGSLQVAATQGRDTAYCVSKAALNMLSVKSAAALRADGIAVVMLHPGWVQTDMGGSDAALTVAQSADAIVRTVADLVLADSGRFIRWDGVEHPW